MSGRLRYVQSREQPADRYAWFAQPLIVVAIMVGALALFR